MAANKARHFNSHGELIREVTENTDPEVARKATSVFAYRPQLVEQLMETALSSGVEIKTGVKVASVNVEKSKDRHLFTRVVGTEQCLPLLLDVIQVRPPIHLGALQCDNVQNQCVGLSHTWIL